MDDDTQLIEAALEGSRAAFQTLVERYQLYLFTIVLRILPLREEAEEVAQGIFLKVYKPLDSFEHK